MHRTAMRWKLSFFPYHVSHNKSRTRDIKRTVVMNALRTFVPTRLAREPGVLWPTITQSWRWCIVMHLVWARVKRTAKSENACCFTYFYKCLCTETLHFQLGKSFLSVLAKERCVCVCLSVKLPQSTILNWAKKIKEIISHQSRHCLFNTQ